ncbi:glutamate receptor ionotropic, kainate 2-like isoform X2 [Paramacrobiotus metropolitanus]|uniref:glutamate receptor ionotropic, kainate 2-like isoform X2 n=1 Tax=Paramacrobiotus metropolitanus TaxID=2943436 RepID=UPI0024462A35|nr:glutamate receptor ionotropic, kainate 2-like isoform X2 [Paramacrobiotus metropolitanus]
MRRCCSVFAFLPLLCGLSFTTPLQRMSFGPYPQRDQSFPAPQFSRTVKIGITLEGNRNEQFLEQALRFAIMEINLMQNDFHFAPIVNYVESGNLLKTSRTFCRSVNQGATIQFIPTDAAAATLFQSACDRLDLMCMDIHQRDPTFSVPTFSLQPDNRLIGIAITDILRHYGLNQSAAIVDGHEDVPRLDSIIWYGAQHNISIEVFYKNTSSYRPLLRHLRSEQIFVFLVAIRDSQVSEFVENVFQLNMHDSAYTFVFMGLNVLLDDLTDVSFIGLNLLTLSPIDVVNYLNSQKMTQMIAYAESNGVRLNGPEHDHVPNIIPMEAAFLYDTLHLLARTLDHLAPLPDDFFEPVSCEKSSRWAYGSSILNYLYTVGTEGLTGNNQLKNADQRDYSLHVMKLMETGLTNVGAWHSKTGLEIFASILTSDSRQNTVRVRAGTAEDPFMVATVLQEPFLKLKEEFKKELAMKNQTVDIKKITKDHVEGFIIDLMDKLAAATATFSVAPFTITAEREAYISFTKPFMTTGIGILYQQPRGSAQNLFALMRSLSAELWLSSFGAALIIALSMWLIARFSPLEWDNRHLCTGVETRFAVNAFNLRNSVWFSVCSLMMQGCDINPRAVSTRVLGGVWWFYTLFLSAHFIAKLASVLTVEKMTVPFSTVDELVAHAEIKYGILGNGSTYEFFRGSRVDIYREMFEKMNYSVPSVFVADYKEGVDRVMSEQYAFLMEASEIDYLVERNCNVTRIGGTLNTIQYGIGTAKGSPWTDKLSEEILNMIEQSTIPELVEKWWKRGSICVKEEKSTGPSAINSTLVGGAFLLLAMGLILAILMAVVEFIWNALHNAHIEKKSLWAEFLLELRYALKFKSSSTRPVLQKVCPTCGVEMHSIAAAQSHEHRDYTPMMFLNNAIKRSASIFG